METEKRKSQERELPIKAYTINNVQELIRITNFQLEDILYISDNVFIPEKKAIGRCYRSEFTLKTQKEAEELYNDKKVKLYHNRERSDFFVYNERAKKMLPFKKNDYLIYEHGYFTFDGTDYFSYDDNGNEIGRFSFEGTDEKDKKDSTLKKSIQIKKKSNKENN